MNFSYETALGNLKQRDSHDRSEEDVKADIIEPVLQDALGYTPGYIRRENQLRGKRPDFICRRPDGELDLIVEAKDLSVNLDLRPSQSDPATRIPKIQLEEYLRKRPDSKHGVFGLLTNGEEWRVCRRIESDVVWLSSETAKTTEELRDALRPLIVRETIAGEANLHSTERGLEILSQLESASDHRTLIEKLVPVDSDIEHQTNLVSSLRLSDIPKVSGHLFGENHFVTIGSLARDGKLPVADIYGPLRETYLLNPAVTAIGIGIAFDEQNTSNPACRIFAWDGNSLHTSNLFDPALPGTRVLRQLESLARWQVGESNDLIDLLSARTVQTEFYDEIAKWFERTGTELEDLRHLIRVLFTWFLKEHGVIPTELFEKHPAVKIHEQMEHLFTQTLSTEPNQRRIPNQLIHLKKVFEDAPFLNGSLFNDDPRLLRSELADSHYISAGETYTGLFTILKRYEWTLTEHDQLRSDTALDPSMIGSIFERFLALAADITPGPLAKQPDGTYYTPKDLTEEMVCDALAHHLTQNIIGMEFDVAFDLLHPVDLDESNKYQHWQSPYKQKVIENLRKVTVLDPCTGSGEFIVSVLNTLRRAERRLLGDDQYDDMKRVRDAIANQLYAVDVHPMAVQVTRFRFYLAMIGTQLTVQPNVPLGPFPNLETRISAGNSLATRLSDSDEFEGSFLDSDDMREWRAIRDSYTYTHSSVEKKRLCGKEAQIRRRLAEKPDFAAPHLIEWLNDESLGNESVVSQCGLPILFGKDYWDIVIGNPPYQRPKNHEKNVAKQFGYGTVGCGDLYCLFVELGTHLVGKSGVLTLVVPHSLCFADQKQKLREICERAATSIHLRTYNNRPTAVFPPHPFIKGGRQGAENRQRITVMSLHAGTPDVANKPVIHASCYIGLQNTLRREILRRRPASIQPPSNQWNQWTMAGTKTLAKLLEEMRDDRPVQNTMAKFRTVTFPPTAHYFLTCLPQEILDSPRRKKIGVPNDEFFWPRICLFNSTVFHAYWLMVGDAFDVLPRLFTSIRLPPVWALEPPVRIEAEKIGKEFCNDEVLIRSATVFRQARKEFPNYDFHTHEPELVRRADQICIEGYGLKEYESELQEQIQKVRQFRTWDM